MLLRIALLLLLTALPALALDDLDDLDIDPAPVTAGTPRTPGNTAGTPRTPGKPSAASSPAPAPGPKPDDIDLSELDGTGLPGASEKPAPSVLPGGLKDGWNLVAALSIVLDLKRDLRPDEIPLKSWQALRVHQEIHAVLEGATDIPAPLKAFLNNRLAALTAQPHLGEDIPMATADMDIDGLGADPVLPATRPSTPGPDVPPVDAAVEDASRQLSVLDRADLARAQEIATTLATKAGDPGSAKTLAAVAARGAELAAFGDRIRALIHRPPGGAWLIRQLGSGQPAPVAAALDYLRDAATLAEQREVLAAVADKRVSGAAARDVAHALGALGTAGLIPDFEAAAKDASGELARAVGESIGRIRQRAEELASYESDSGGMLDRRDTGARFNKQGVPLYRGGRYRDAVVKFRIAIQLDPTVSSHYYNLGSALYRLGNVTEAQANFEHCLSLGSDEVPFYELAIASLRDLGRRTDLVSFLEERTGKVRYSAILVLLWVNLAHEYGAQGDADRALQAVQIAFSRSVPNRFMPALYARKGDAHMLAGEAGLARRAYEKSLELAPDYRRAVDGILRADAWAPAAGEAVATTTTGSGVSASGSTSAGSGPLPTPSADPFSTETGDPLAGLDLDDPAPKASGKPAPAASVAPDGLDDIDL